MLQKSTKWGTFGHLGKSIDILGETLAAVTELAIRAGNVSMCVVNIAREENASMHLAPVSPHLLTVLTAGVKIGHLIGPEHIVHILSQFGFKRGHHGKLLAHEDAS